MFIGFNLLQYLSVIGGVIFGYALGGIVIYYFWWRKLIERERAIKKREGAIEAGIYELESVRNALELYKKQRDIYRNLYSKFEEYAEKAAKYDKEKDLREHFEMSYLRLLGDKGE